ncbi:hypothetical protein [Flavobacterium maritimum]|jgi:uncharacterized membrane protein|uniref:hypothetical protein n=1 Tax=Flavobacterium maritimum TaxID=3149042 RepID=UPI0032B42DBC
MKKIAIKLVWFTTVYVFVFAGLVQTNAPIAILMLLYGIGILLILFMVYAVLHDDYKTTKTFKDWYNNY